MSTSSCELLVWTSNCSARQIAYWNLFACVEQSSLDKRGGTRARRSMLKPPVSPFRCFRDSKPSFRSWSDIFVIKYLATISKVSNGSGPLRPGYNAGAPMTMMDFNGENWGGRKAETRLCSIKYYTWEDAGQSLQPPPGKSLPREQSFSCISREMRQWWPVMVVSARTKYLRLHYQAVLLVAADSSAAGDRRKVVPARQTKSSALSRVLHHQITWAKNGNNKASLPSSQFPI